MVDYLAWRIMFLKQVKEIDYNSGEADVIITDGEYELMCYCHPMETLTIGTKIKEISAMFAENIMQVDNQTYFICKGNDYYSYFLRGKIIDKRNPKIGVGGIVIKLDKPLAKDIEEGEFVELKVSRINCCL